MRKMTAIAIFAGIMFAALMGYSPKSFAGVSVNIGIGVPLPQVVLRTPPPVVVIPGTYAYYAPDAGVDIFFYHGFWYRPHHGYWYRARGYNGPWVNIRHARVPLVLRNLPPDFRRTVRQRERIRYSDFHRNWRAWEKEKHWDKHVYRHEVRDARRVERREIHHGRPEVKDVRHDVKMESKNGNNGYHGRHEEKKPYEY
jgi:hypothetical protein